MKHFTSLLAQESRHSKTVTRDTLLTTKSMSANKTKK